MSPDSLFAELEIISATTDASSTTVDASLFTGVAGLSARLQAANATRLNMAIVFEFTVFLSLKIRFLMRTTSQRIVPYANQLPASIFLEIERHLIIGVFLRQRHFDVAILKF